MRLSVYLFSFSARHIAIIAVITNHLLTLVGHVTAAVFATLRRARHGGEQYEEVIDGRPVMRSKGVMLTNYFKRWYFHVKSSQRIVDATKLADMLMAQGELRG